MGAGVVPELGDEGMTLERLLDDAALDAAAAAVNEAQRAQTARVRGRDVLLDHRRDILRRERVQIELRLDGKLEGIVGHGVRRRRDARRRPSW